MAERNHHIILRQVFDLVLPPGGDGFAIQKEIGQLAMEKLAPQLEELLDRYAPPDELIQIDTLEIDIGHVLFMSSGDALTTAILKAVEEKLIALIPFGGSETKRVPVVAHRFGHWLFYLENGHLPWQASFADAESLHLAVLEQLSTDSAAVTHFRQLALRHPLIIERLVMQYPEPFLIKLLATITTGRQDRLPSWRKEVWRLLQALAIFQKKKELLSERQCYRIFWEWSFRQAVLEKTTNVEGSEVVIGFLENWISENSKFSPRGGHALRIALTEAIRTGSRKFPLLRKLLDEMTKRTLLLQQQEGLASHVPQGGVADENEGDGKEGYEGRAKQDEGATTRDVDTPSNEKREPEKSIGLALRKEGVEVSQNEKDITFDQQELQSTDNKKSPLKEGKVLEKAEAIPEIPIQEKEGTDSTAVSPDPGKVEDNNGQDFQEPIPRQSGKILHKKSEFPDYPEGSSWYVRHAGVVLLHPFFVRYFNQCGLLKNSDFVNEEAQQRAVHLVQYLSSDETGVAEYDLVLPKFLCGIPFGVPIEREVSLTEEEKSEGGKLLRSAIEHWDKLGNTSPDGLRQGFLHRDGKLEKRQQGWYLTVEQKGIDVLLDFLPWNLRMVKLRWMPDLLRVEWG